MMINKLVKLNPKEKLVILYFLIDNKWSYKAEISKGMKSFKDDLGKEGVSEASVGTICNKLHKEIEFLEREDRKYPKEMTPHYRLKIRWDLESFILISERFLGYPNQFYFIDTKFSKELINEELGYYILIRLAELNFGNKLNNDHKKDLKKQSEEFIEEFGDSPSALYWGLFAKDSGISSRCSLSNFYEAVTKGAEGRKVIDAIAEPERYKDMKYIRDIFKV